MKLSDFIRSNREPILVEWEAFARSMPSATEGMSVSELRDHGGVLIDAIAADMENAQTDRQQSEKSKGRGDNGVRLDRVGNEHGGDRAESGFRMEQVVAEFRALRASVIRLWEKSQLDGADRDGVTRFHEAIDQALAQSVTQSMQRVTSYRDLFVGILGHDLRNPLSAIHLTASALLQSEETSDKARKSAARILRSTAKMTQMIGDLLDLTRTRFGKSIPIELKALNIGEVCGAAVDEMQAGHPDWVIRYSTMGNLDGRWDEGRVGQLVSNLVANACRHGKEASPVTVAVSDSDEQVVIAVHNEGDPIPDSAIGMLFEPLVQGARKKANGQETAQDGLGLGLYIVKQIASAHGGQVDVKSSAAEGTTFTVRLPRDCQANKANI